MESEGLQFTVINSGRNINHVPSLIVGCSVGDGDELKPLFQPSC